MKYYHVLTHHSPKMKKLLLILIVFINQSLAQTKPLKQATPKQNTPNKQQLPKLMEFGDVIDITAMMDKTYWSLGIEYQENDNKPAEPDEVIISIDSLLSSGKSTHEAELYYIKKYKESVDSIFNDMKLIGNSLGKFVYAKNSEVPLRICTYNDTAKIFFITGIALEDIYNTLRLTSRQRATKVITTYLIPTLKALKPIMNKEFNYLGLGAIYGSKDFGDNSALAMKAEYILFVVPAKKTNDFIKGKITEDELVENADIISADRDMVTGTKRIKITLE